MHSTRNTDTGAPAKLAVICQKSDCDRIHRVLNDTAGLDWKTAGEIVCIPVLDEFHGKTEQVRHRIRPRNRDVSALVDAAVPPSTAGFLLSVGRVKYEPALAADHRLIRGYSSCEKFQEALSPLLKQCGLDWMSQAVRQIGHYHLSTIEATDVSRWLTQFEKLGCLWIGEALLKMLEVWPTARVTEALFDFGSENANGNWANSYKLVLHNDASKGKSATLISRLITKQLGTELGGKIKSLPDALKGDRRLESEEVIFFEDCIMTGQECIRVCDPATIQFLRKNSVHFRFAIGTSFGVERFRAFLNRNGITRFKIDVPERSFIQNLNPVGMAAARNDQLFDEQNNITDKSLITDGINIRGCSLLKREQRKEIARFCRITGKGLMFNHFLQNGEAASANDMASENALGFGNLGLLVAFAHGVPDNTIPLFRMGGDVSFEGEPVKWIPLFSPA